MKIIEVVSMRRAGHHAFVNWLVSNLLKSNGESGYCEYKFNVIDSGNVVWIRYYKLLVRSALETNGIVFDKWIQNETYSDKALRDILGIERKVNPLSTKGTHSSFGDTTPTVNSLLNRRSQAVFPKWFLDIVEQDDELAKLLVKLQILIN
jgi:hypothetical protein